MYAALKRFLNSDKVTQAALEKWAVAEEKGPHAKFEFLQSWARDTSGGNITLAETHEQQSEENEKTKYRWVTKWDLYNMK